MDIREEKKNKNKTLTRKSVLSRAGKEKQVEKKNKKKCPSFLPVIDTIRILSSKTDD